MTAQANGEVIFSYGSDKIETVNVQAIQWIKNDIYFNLLQYDGNLSSGDLIDMASEIIKKTIPIDISFQSDC